MSSALHAEASAAPVYKSSVDPALPTREKDVFRGFFAEDFDRVRAIMPAGLTPDPRAFTDALGVRISPEYCPWIAGRVGKVEARLPFPTDTYLGEAVEYVGFAHAIATAENRRRLSVVELGAGWGPWVSLGGVVGPRMGFEEIRIVAFEADSARFAALRKHLALNGIVGEDAPDAGQAPGLDWRLHDGAAHWENGTLYWPAEADANDAGNAAIADPGAATDYRGLAIATKAIKAVSVAEALDHLDMVDFMHVDIQGGEEELLPKLMDVLTEKVRVLFIGTHSRKIEGDFIGMFESRKWFLARERPCQFYSMAQSPTLAGRTYVDGAQLWLNLNKPAA